MAQTIKQGDLFGRIGSGIGQGLAQQLPEEITRGRTVSGLNKFEQEAGNLTPLQQGARLLGIPGMTPQGIQTMGDLARQQAYLNSLKNQYEGQGESKNGSGGYMPTEEDLSTPMKGGVPTLATSEATRESYKNFIPPTQEEEERDAYESFKKNPDRYGRDFNKALARRKDITARNIEIQKAYNEQEKIAVGKENIVKDALKAENDKLGITNVPPEVLQKSEERVLNGVLSKAEGGEGLTQEQAVNKESKRLIKANQNYIDLGTLSPWSPQEFNRRKSALQKDFKERGDQKQMAEKLIKNHGVSPPYAYNSAYPIKPGDLPTLDKVPNYFKDMNAGMYPKNHMNNAKYEQLKKEMGKTYSPLSIAYELERKQQDATAWLNYLDKHRDNLEVWQADEVSKPKSGINITDMWLRAWE